MERKLATSQPSTTTHYIERVTKYRVAYTKITPSIEIKPINSVVTKHQTFLPPTAPTSPLRLNIQLTSTQIDIKN